MPAQVATAPSLSSRTRDNAPSPSPPPPPPFPKPRRTLVTRLQGALFAALLLLCGLYICWLILPIFFLLLLVDVSLAQRLLDCFIAAYLSLPAGLLETFGVRVLTYGDPPPPPLPAPPSLSSSPTTPPPPTGCSSGIFSFATSTSASSRSF